MPRGVYKRTKSSSVKQLEALSKGRNLPKTAKQLRALSEGRKFPTLTRKRIEASQRNAYKAHKLPRTQKQLEASRNALKPYIGKANVHGDDIVEHHNDLQHGALRPDDVTLMTLSEHTTFHNKLKVENGTHNLLRKNQMRIF